MRARFPGDILARLINHEANRQCFIRVGRTPEHAAAEIYDGCTVYVPQPASPAARAAIERAADAAFLRETEPELIEVPA
jgi:demethoxyubiquinone hydroxylase (CLK1/Coq7/Cat5 family)